MLAALHVHLRSGDHLAFEVPAGEAREFLREIRAAWDLAPEFQTGHVGLGDGVEPTCWIATREIAAVQLEPLPDFAQPTAEDRRAADDQD